MSINWSIEWPEIQAKAQEYGVDPFFIAAIRKAENGDAGREFGVLSENAPDYDSQLAVCCATVRDRIVEFAAQTMSILQGPQVRRLVYGSGFVTFFARKWAPIGAENDPTNLNENWYSNVTRFYLMAVRAGLPQ